MKQTIPVSDDTLLSSAISHSFLQHGVTGHATVLVEVQGVEEAVVKAAHHRTLLTTSYVHHQIPEAGKELVSPDNSYHRLQLTKQQCLLPT